MRIFLVKAKIPLLIILAFELVLLLVLFVCFNKQKNEQQPVISATEVPTLPPTEVPTEEPTATPVPEFSASIVAKITGDASENIKTEINGNEITAKYPYTFDEKKLKNMSVSVSGENVSSVEIAKSTGLSAWEKTEITVIDTNGLSEKFTFSFMPDAHNLPVVALYNDGPVTSKSTYVKGKIYATGEWGLDGVSMQIKGRGNASWHSTDKKSYRIKLDEKAPVLGLKANRDFVLVSNYFDKSLMRNVVAHEMAKTLDKLYYTPTHILVDLFLDGKYMGVYTFCDKIEEANSKVDLDSEKNTDSDMGFLLEIGWDYESQNVYGKNYFDLDSKRIVRLFLKEPKPTTVNSPQMNFARNYLNKTDKTIASRGNYADLVDVDNFVDWFILAELTNNTEMAFHRSTYMYKPAGGKLTLGPVWDFDMAFGNHNGDREKYDGWATAEAVYYYVGDDTWMTYLVKDEAFVAKVKARWNEKKQELLDTAFNTIDKNYALLKDSAAENFKKWNILGERVGEGRVDYHKYNTHELQVSYLKEFITMRAEWIDGRLGG